MRNTERGGRQRHSPREKQAPCRESDVGLDPGSPGSRPGLQAALNRCATGAALLIIFLKRFYLFIYERYRKRERGRDTSRGRSREPDVELDPRTPGSHPGPKAGAKPRSHPGIPRNNLLTCSNQVILVFFLHKNGSVIPRLNDLGARYSMLNQTNFRSLNQGTPGWLSGLASAFSSGCDPGVLGSSFILGSPKGACFSLCLCL